MAEFVTNFGEIIRNFCLNFMRIVEEFKGNNCEENLKMFRVNFENIRNIFLKILRKLLTNVKQAVQTMLTISQKL